MQRRSTSPTPVSRGEFGAVAVPRILELLGGRDIPCTFFIPGHTIETYPDVCRMVADAGCEIGLHGYAHEFNPGLDEERERWALVKSIELIEGLTGAAPVGYRAPSGDLTDQTVKLLLEHGVVYDSSLMGHDYQPYRVRTGDSFPDDAPAQWGPETDLIELPFSWTLDDYVYLEFVTFRRMLMPGLKRPDDMFANFSDDVRWMVREVDQGVCNVVFHPQVIGRGHRLMALERWLDTMAALEVNFARMDQVATAVQTGRRFGVE
ncbi:MAG: polysaccharide deacetylase [Actinomycetia bacterium]|nr:polysaccharide deacetylase [Actinomycetes bacterium]